MDPSPPRFADRSTRGKLRFSGPQRAWFLDQILTQSFEDAATGDARDAAMLTVHGRMTAFLETVTTEDAILVHFEPELRSSFPEDISRYVFATRVDIEDATDRMGLVLIMGEGRHDLLDGLDVSHVVHPTASLGVPADYLWIEREHLEDVLAHLKKAGSTEISEDELEAIRIEAGAPRWGYEMDAKTFPQEAGIDQRAVRYDKGCYLGQEAMAKIHFRGKVNRRLVSLNATGAVEVGAEISHDDKKIGKVTSAAGSRGLALIRYDVGAGAAVEVDRVPAEVVN